MGDDEGIKSLAVAELEPCHVELGCGGAAPLARLEEDYAHRPAGEAHFLEGGDEDALGV